MKPCVLRFAAALVLFGLAGVARGADDAVTLNFVNADIEAVVKAVGEITGRNFILDPKVKGNISIISNQPVARHLVYPTLLSALRLQGFAAVESAGAVKIVPETDAKLHAPPVVGSSAGGDQLVTKIFTLRSESAGQMVSVLRPLVPANNPVTAFPGTNSLVVTDYAENMKRIEQIIAAIDRPEVGEPLVVPLKFASAADLAPTLNKVMGEGSGAVDPGQRVTLVAELRSNSLILRSENASKVARMKALIEQLDTPSRAGSNIHIVYLKHAEAVRVAQTLRAVLTGQTASETAASPVSAATNAASTMAATPVAAVAQAGATSTAFSAGGITVHADAANNALIVAAPESVYNGLREVIEKLDARRAQVFVEALVVEVTAEKAAEFGIQWQTLDNLSSENGTRGIGGTNFGARGSGQNIIDTASNLGSAGQGLNIGIVRGQVTLPGIGTIANLGLLARALESNANANILSTPNLLTLDNEEAKIVIGQNVPFITGQYAQTGSSTTATPFQTIERRDVGLTLRVKPQVTEGGTVRLQIYQEISNVQDTTNAAGVITNKRALETTVLVDDGQTVVLGGLIQDSLTDGSGKVPLLGDAPLIGNLFRYDTRKRAKTNLMIFLRPQVLRSAQSGQGVTADRYDLLLGEQKKQTPEARFFWSDTGAPQLPALNPPAKN